MEDHKMTFVNLKTRPAYYNVFDHLFANQGYTENNCQPMVNIFNQDKAFVIEMAVPGYSKEDFSINLEQQVLKISAEPKQKEVDDDKFLRKEFSLNGVKRNFTIPKNIDTDNISADFRDGLLKITLPRREEPVLRKEISIA